MPLFNYICDACGEQAEILVRGEKAPACPACGSSKLTKQASGFARPAGGGAAEGEAPPCGSCCGGQNDSCPYAG